MNDTTTPTYRPALPGEVMEIIKSTLWYSMPSAQVLEATERVCAALAPHWRRMEEEIARLNAMTDIDAARASLAEKDAEIEKLRMHLNSERQAKVERGDMIAELEAHLKGAFREGGYEYFSNAIRAEQRATFAAQQSARDAIARADDARVAELEKEVERLTESQRRYEQLDESQSSKISELSTSLAAARRDGERLDWLSMQCYLPGDHPDDGLLVVVSEKYAPLGSFTSSQKNDAKVFRAAIDAARAISSAQGFAQRSTQGGKEGQ